MTTKNIQDVVTERLGYLKDFPVSPDPDCTVSVYEEVIDVFTQLVKEVEVGERQAIKDILQGMEASQTAHNSEYVWSVNATLDIAIREINKRSTPTTSDEAEN